MFAVMLIQAKLYSRIGLVHFLLFIFIILTTKVYYGKKNKVFLVESWCQNSIHWAWFPSICNTAPANKTLLEYTDTDQWDQTAKKMKMQYVGGEHLSKDADSFSTAPRLASRRSIFLLWNSSIPGGQHDPVYLPCKSCHGKDNDSSVAPFFISWWVESGGASVVHCSPPI